MITTANSGFYFNESINNTWLIFRGKQYKLLEVLTVQCPGCRSKLSGVQRCSSTITNAVLQRRFSVALTVCLLSLPLTVWKTGKEMMESRVCPHCHRSAASQIFLLSPHQHSPWQSREEMVETSFSSFSMLLHMLNISSSACLDLGSYIGLYLGFRKSN